MGATGTKEERLSDLYSTKRKSDSRLNEGLVFEGVSSVTTGGHITAEGVTTGVVEEAMKLIERTAPPDSLKVNDLSTTKDTVPVVFRWDQGGNKVHLVASFIGWGYRNVMHRSGNDFSLICDVPRDGKKHHYKFIVDGEWRIAADQLSERDDKGGVNNIIEFTDFRTYSETEAILAERAARTGSLENVLSDERRKDYGKHIPEAEEYAKDPPILPQQLRHVILNQANKSSSSGKTKSDPRKLGIPLHVSLNHLFCSVIKDGIMVQGITTRYRKKMVTSVYITLEKEYSDNLLKL